MKTNRYQQVFSKKLLDGKVCLITGGSRGGVLKDIALQFAAHGAAAVILMSRKVSLALMRSIRSTRQLCGCLKNWA